MASRKQPLTNLRQLLLKRLLTQTQSELAKDLGVGQAWVSERIRGVGGRTQRSKLARVAKGLGVTVRELVEMEAAGLE